MVKVCKFDEVYGVWYGDAIFDEFQMLGIRKEQKYIDFKERLKLLAFQIFLSLFLTLIFQYPNIQNQTFNLRYHLLIFQTVED